jgi:hypothetical protein
MRPSRPLVAGFVFACLASAAAPPAFAAPGDGLSAFSSDAELRAYLHRVAKWREDGHGVPEPPPPPPAPPPMPSPPPPPPPGSMSAPAPAMKTAIPAVGTQSITNNQEVGVDEGDIVKVSGDNLVILRRGRLFTVSLAGGRMRPVDSINAFPPGVSGAGDWYDEMLISGDRIVVVGYSYARGGTEINRFRVDPTGKLRFEDAWHLRSNDYYSSRNYASRLIGDRLIFYTPMSLDLYDDDSDPFEQFPGIRRWQGDPKGKYRRLVGARRIYIPPVMRNSPEARIEALHSVISCDLTAPDLGCSATGVLGPESRTFYVSPRGVYLWIGDAWGYDSKVSGPHAYVYRLPFGRERPSAVAARGAPVDQFSFREDGADGLLNVLLRSEGGGDSMFGPEVSGRGVALLRLRFSDFGDGSREAPRRRYRILPGPQGNDWNFHNRFAGPWVLYGAGAYGEAAQRSVLYAAPLGGGAVAQLPVGHSVDRIELIGSDALAVGGTPRGLGFTAVDLGAPAPRTGDFYLHPDAAEGETRSHAFFFNPDPDSPDGASGTAGLPVARRADPALARFFGSSASMVFLRREQKRLAPAGELEAQTRGVADDACKASCVDWYGNARPIFLGGRTFALLGYELVEGELAGGRIREVARISFAPPPSGQRQ